MNNDEVLLKTYDDAKLLLQDATFLLSNHLNEYRAKTDIEKQIKEKISESLKTCVADVLTAANIIGEIYNAGDDETLLKYCLKEAELCWVG